MCNNDVSIHLPFREAKLLFAARIGWKWLIKNKVYTCLQGVYFSQSCSYYVVIDGPKYTKEVIGLYCIVNLKSATTLWRLGYRISMMAYGQEK